MYILKACIAQLANTSNTQEYYISNNVQAPSGSTK